VGTVRADPVLVLSLGGTTLESPLAPLAAAFHDAIPMLMTRAATAAA
jgi:hypothetical protein